jgi:hypothetical protein
MSKLAALVLVALALTRPLPAQTPQELERRITELEKKVRQLDPSFQIPPAAEGLAARLEALEKRLDSLLAAKEKAAPATPAAAPQAPLQPVSVSGDFQTSGRETRLPVSGYMDFHVNKDRGDPFRPDFHRFVLLFGHSFSDRVRFWSELELEHSLTEAGLEGGEVALEQAYLDFLAKPYLNFRAGMVLTPVGIVNERHEPPSFHGVERPFVETVIIPTTWRELGFGLTGDLGRGFRYRAYLTSSLDAARFSAESGITEGRTKGVDASLHHPAISGRLEYNGVRRLMLGVSLYTGGSGFATPGVNPRVTLMDADGRYSFRRMDFRALFANTWISRAGELNRLLQMHTGVNPNVAQQLRGYYLEPAFHLMPRRLRHDLALFGRYERYNTQQEMPAGYVPLAQFDRSSWVTGVTYKPVADVAVKFDYVFHRNASSVVRERDGINFGLGWWF